MYAVQWVTVYAVQMYAVQVYNVLEYNLTSAQYHLYWFILIHSYSSLFILIHPCVLHNSFSLQFLLQCWDPGQERKWNHNYGKYNILEIISSVAGVQNLILIRLWGGGHIKIFLLNFLNFVGAGFGSKTFKLPMEENQDWSNQGQDPDPIL